MCSALMASQPTYTPPNVPPPQKQGFDKAYVWKPMINLPVIRPLGGGTLGV